MRIEIYTKKPETLKSTIFKKAEDEELSTWKIRKNGKEEKFVTHTGQWEDRAILKFTSSQIDNKLIVNISWWSKNEEPDSNTKGIYLGRFSEALLNHFNEYYSSFETFYK